jgi:TRAP-type C4-dicarboxylate transport system permease small subunit
VAPPPAGGGTTLLATLGRIQAAVRSVAWVMNAAAGWVFVACAAFITFDVVARNFFGFSSRSTTEITGYMLAFGIAWGLSHALAERSHVRVDVLINKLPMGARQYLHALALALLAVFAGYAAWGACQLVLESLDFGATDMSALHTPLAIPQGLWAFGLSVFFVLTVLMLAEVLVLLALGRGAEVDALLSSRTYQEEADEALAAAHEGQDHP